MLKGPMKKERERVLLSDMLKSIEKIPLDDNCKKFENQAIILKIMHASLVKAHFKKVALKRCSIPK